MKRALIFFTFFFIIGCLMYFSSVYLVRAEQSFKEIEQKAKTIDMPVQSVKTEPAKDNALKSPILSIAENRPEAIIILPPKETAQTETTTTETAGTKLISMDFENAKLKDVLKVFCQQSGLNFIAGTSIEAKPVTLYLSNVTVDDALNSIINANGLSYKKAEGSNVFIVTQSTEPAIKTETRLYKLKYAYVEEKKYSFKEESTEKGSGTTSSTEEQTFKPITDSIKKLLSPNGDLTIDNRTNSLIITDIPSKFEIIEKFIKELDAQAPQILIEVKIVEITTDDLDQVGLKWSSLAGYRFGYYNPVRYYESLRSGGRNRTDTYTTTTSDLTEDLQNRMYDPDGTVYEGPIMETQTVSSNFGRSLIDTFSKGLANTDLRSAYLAADSFQLTLSLLLTDKNADLISSPNIVTEDGKFARIVVGEQYPIPSYTYNEENNVWEVQGFTYKDIGIILHVTPKAAIEENTISLDLHPQVSSFLGTASFGGSAGAEIPIIAVREAITNVMIKDGDTLAIGGLIENINDDTFTKVPLLGDIPVLGNLFKHKQTQKKKRNLVIFITPHILKDGKITETENREANIRLEPSQIPEIVTQTPPKDKQKTEQIKQPQQTAKKEETKQGFTHR